MKDTTPTRRTKPGLVPRLLLATAAFLFALLVAELGTRFLRPEPWYEQILRDQQLLSTPPPFRPLGELTKLYVRDHLRQTRKPQGCQRILFPW